MKNDPYTLYIALDRFNQAFGELYMDDEHSFNYERKKEYSVAKFTVKDGNTIRNDVSIVSSWSDYDRTIERIIVMGVTDAPTNVSVNEGRVLSFDYDPIKKILLIRKPELSAATNWTIHIE